MRIIVINAQSDFSLQQQSDLAQVGSVEYIESHPDYSADVFSDDEEKIIALGPEVVDWEFTNETSNKINNLKAVCLPTTGFGWVDGAVLKSRGVVLTDVPKYSTESVAEYAIWMMLSVVRKIPLLIKNEWKLDYAKHLGDDVRGKTMGIVGLGSIGTRIAEMGKAMGMEVVYWSRTARDARFTYLELDSLLGTADFLFPTLAKNSDTSNVLNAKKIALLKKDASIISITGTDVCDIDYATKQVAAGALQGIAFESEKATMAEHQGNVLVTPPIAWYTKDAVAEDMRIWVETIVACAQGAPINVVN